MGYEYVAGVRMVTEECCAKGCGITFAITEDLYDRLQGHPDRWFYCPNGHDQHYTGKSDAQKLKDAEARELALRDQLEASIRDGETTRRALIRDRHRFANGVCPCCNRSFGNVRRHMASQHPDYDATDVTTAAPRYRCSCGREFETPHGLHIHQGRQRSQTGRWRWDKPGQSRWFAHLTEAASR